jgi:Arc/MetJ-type ribon-helix-helix transcriptional regulator
MNRAKPLRKVANPHKQRVVTIRLDEAILDRINRRVPDDYRTVSALVRAGIDEILTNENSSNSRIDR